eukprot:5919217-Pleurochrysis_carterae.AAC.1
MDTAAVRYAEYACLADGVVPTSAAQLAVAAQPTAAAPSRKPRPLAVKICSALQTQQAVESVLQDCVDGSTLLLLFWKVQ